MSVRRLLSLGLFLPFALTLGGCGNHLGPGEPIGGFGGNGGGGGFGGGGKDGGPVPDLSNYHGPVIKFYKPTTTPVKGIVAVEFTVDDPLYPITSLSQVKAGIRSDSDVTLTQVADAVPFRVTGQIDATLFNPPLDGRQLITATAENSNSDKATETQAFVIDNSGPLFTGIKPVTGSYIGGPTDISATIIDKDKLSEIDETSTVVVFGGNLANTVQLHRMAPGSDTFIGTYNVDILGTSFISPVVSFRAKDKAGNASEYAHQLIVDNTRPWLTMDSQWKMRVSRLTNGMRVCSQLFSPIGDDAAHEGQTVQQILTVRARVEDRGNWAPGLNVIRYSGLDPNRPPTMFAMPIGNGTTPLAVDTDGDGYCDDFNPKLTPTSTMTMSGQALSVQLASLSLLGSPDYRPDGASPPIGCDQMGDPAATLPPLICTLAGTTLRYVKPFPDPQPQFTSPIYTIPPIYGGGDQKGCVGRQLDSLNSLPEGWTCFITRAYDFTGRVNVSYPLHLCIDRGGGLCAGPPPDPTACTGIWDKTTQQLVPGTCAEGQTFPHDDTEVYPLP